MQLDKLGSRESNRAMKRRTLTPDGPKQTVVARLRDTLEQLIRDEWRPGQQLPSEADLTRRFDISRPALREALKLLEEDGLLTVAHGKGRFVTALARMPVQRPITRFESVTQMLRASGFDPTVRVLSTHEEPADAALALALQVGEGEILLRMDRLRLHENAALVYCREFIPRALLRAKMDALDLTGSLVELLATLERKPVISTASVAAVVLPPDIAALSEMAAFGPALLIVETAYDAAGTPVIHAQDYHRGTDIQFSFIRK